MGSKQREYTICVPCGRGWHQECSHKKGCSKCHDTQQIGSKQNEPRELISYESEQPKSRKSRKENLRDPGSTGRKRAAVLYPLDRSAPCEWRSLRNCGGGLKPIVGCYDGNQQHRHHGPVKDTTRNEQGNVHRICNDCHVHWHELNDLEYDSAKNNLLPHQPEPAPLELLIQNKIDWKSGKMGRENVLASSKNREKHAASVALHSPDPDEE